MKSIVHQKTWAAGLSAQVKFKRFNRNYTCGLRVLRFILQGKLCQPWENSCKSPVTPENQDDWTDGKRNQATGPKSIPQINFANRFRILSAASFAASKAERQCGPGLRLERDSSAPAQTSNRAVVSGQVLGSAPNFFAIRYQKCPAYIYRFRWQSFPV